MKNTIKDVVIVGGSLSGLMCGIMLKDLGYNVQIFEQSAASLREDHASGISVGPHVREFCTLHRISLESISYHSPEAQIYETKHNSKRNMIYPLHVTSWKLLFKLLKDHFCEQTVSSGDISEASRPADHQTLVYELGKMVTSINEREGSMEVLFDNLTTGHQRSIKADLVIAADGGSSSVRKLVQPDLRRPYAGFCAWRGLIPEKEISDETKTVIGEKMTLCLTPNSYLVVYIIPGDRGSLVPGERDFNVVWYRNSSTTSAAYREAMTDINGHQHRYNIPAGKLNVDVWRRQCIDASKELPAPFHELFSKITRPFVTAISDCILPQACYMNGNLLVIGDALALTRPHGATATNQAALQVLELRKAMRKETSIEDWEQHVLRSAYLNILQSRNLGYAFMSKRFALYASTCQLHWTQLKYRFQDMFRSWFSIIGIKV